MDKSLILNIIYALSNITLILLQLFRWGLIIYILSSWLPALRESSFGQFLGKIYEPIMEPFRKVIPPLGGMLDLSPILLFVVLWLFQIGLVEVFNALISFVVAF